MKSYSKIKTVKQLMEQNREICLMINDQKCWSCHKKPDGHHHAIPKRLCPIDNVLIPICNNCHKMIHKK